MKHTFNGWWWSLFSLSAERIMTGRIHRLWCFCSRPRTSVLLILPLPRRLVVDLFSSPSLDFNLLLPLLPVIITALTLHPHEPLFIPLLVQAFCLGLCFFLLLVMQRAWSLFPCRTRMHVPAQHTTVPHPQFKRRPRLNHSINFNHAHIQKQQQQQQHKRGGKKWTAFPV